VSGITGSGAIVVDVDVDADDVVVDSSVVVVAFGAVVAGDVSAGAVVAGDAAFVSWQATSASAAATTDMALPNFTS